MGTIEVIRRFIESNWIIEKTVREFLERLPLRIRYGLSYGPTFRSWLGFLIESDQWSRERLEAFQHEQLKDILIHAEKNVSYYRNKFQEYGFRADHFRSIKDIQRLPLLSKSEARRNTNHLIAANIPKRSLIKTFTSGSTGEPLLIYSTKETEEKHWATVIYQWSRAGYYPGAKTVFIETRVEKGGKKEAPSKKYGNILRMSSNYFDADGINHVIDEISAFGPDFIIGLPSAVANLAAHYIKRGREMMLKGVISYSEQVYDWQRNLMNKAFAASVTDTYGMVEKVLHGGECEKSPAYHFFPQYGVAEYCDYNSGQKEIVGTGLINYAMPLIRYRTADICLSEGKKSCIHCGRHHDLIDKIAGRKSDVLINADGDIVSLNLNFDYGLLINIEQIQLYQELPGEVELRIVKGADFTDDDIKNLTIKIKASTGKLGRDIHYRVSFFDKIPRNSGLKSRLIEQTLDLRSFLVHDG